jgi:phenylalanyl-tRNA synthetase alpha chain
MSSSDTASGDRIGALQSEAQEELAAVSEAAALEAFRVKWLGRKGVLTDVLRSLGELAPEERKAMGQAANALKQTLSAAVEEKKAALDSSKTAAAEQIDFSLPGRVPPRGHIHPVTQTIYHIVDIFSELGYQVATGPDIETDYYNFDALNTPDDHPARDTHDTFYVRPGEVLRTHTTPVQIRVMEKVKPPVAVIMPGRVYRVDFDATHSPMFFQVDGLLVDEGVTFADLKGTLYHFIHRLFGEDVQLRFRPHFFPFTEPSAEVDILWTSRDPNTGETRSKWLEILGGGMVHPSILERVGYDQEKYSGFAFGLGLDRITMALHSIPNIHLMYENDLRFLEQF